MSSDNNKNHSSFINVTRPPYPSDFLRFYQNLLSSKTKHTDEYFHFYHLFQQIERDFLEGRDCVSCILVSPRTWGHPCRGKEKGKVKGKIKRKGKSSKGKRDPATVTATISPTIQPTIASP